MLKKLCRWYVWTFGPINQIDGYIQENWDTPFDSGNKGEVETRRWVPDILTNKTLEIIHQRYSDRYTVKVYLNMQLCVSYVDHSHARTNLLSVSDVYISPDMHKTELYYLYKHISKCFN